MYFPTRDRVLKINIAAVQRLPFYILRTAAVQAVSRKRKAHVRKVHSDLVCAPGLQPELKQGIFIIVQKCFVMRNGAFAVRRNTAFDYAFALPFYGRVNDSASVYDAAGNGVIIFSDFSCKLCRSFVYESL